jgi:hypothetical protein
MLLALPEESSWTVVCCPNGAVMVTLLPLRAMIVTLPPLSVIEVRRPLAYAKE